MSDRDPVIILMGLRGCGKSTVGRALASHLDLPFVDLDDAVLEAMGYETVTDAWQEEGEATFRRAETAALGSCIALGGVIALGGGTPTAPGADEVLRRAVVTGATLAYLHGEPDVLRDRLRGETGDRPSLTGDDPLVEIERVYTARDPLYRSLASVVLSCSGTVASRVDAIAAAASGGD